MKFRFQTLRRLPIYLFSAIAFFLFTGWGGSGHRIINRQAVAAFPQTLNHLVQMKWADSLAAHGSDADIRKGWDQTEEVKHYIDIDNYPEFLTTGTIHYNFDTLVARYGYSFVMDQGTLPWAILVSFDSLTAQFSRKDWQKAMLTASDLGHYIGDAHNPFHLTKNYNGQLTGQTGIHSRYESTMISKYLGQIKYDSLLADTVGNVTEEVFHMIRENYQFLDSLLKADLQAKAATGSTSSNAYYEQLWNRTKGITISLFQQASHRLARMIYTAWIAAGAPYPTSIDDQNTTPDIFTLNQNYPNPFNPETHISFTLHQGNQVQLTVYDLNGEVAEELVNAYLPSGVHQFKWNSQGKASGVYFYRLKAGQHSEVRKMMYLQ